LTKTPLIQCFIHQFEGLEICFGGLTHQNPPVATRLLGRNLYIRTPRYPQSIRLLLKKKTNPNGDKKKKFFFEEHKSREKITINT